jgi:hypothetical protein
MRIGTMGTSSSATVASMDGSNTPRKHRSRYLRQRQLQISPRESGIDGYGDIDSAKVNKKHKYRLLVKLCIVKMNATT